ncbi:MAG TPA: hypothetical protein VGR23_03865 [Candidatus Dormibacteraeota bacterium]|nr:hypothetical protein [Candidatus Dormibacteraeota bacterium]
MTAFSIGAAQPASGTIHELVASFCSGRDVQDPPGQSAFGTQSFVRALQATGVIQSIQFGVAPAGQPDPAAGTIPVTVNFDYSRPASKFTATGGFIRIVDTAAGLTVYLTAGVPDHPAFDHCPKLAFLD